MKIINVMSSRALGGVEQAFLDYNEALSYCGHEVFAFYNKRGKIRSKLKEIKNVTYLPSTFLKPYFLLLPFYLLAVKIAKPNLIIIHNKKVLPLFAFIGKLLKVPVIIVSHNEKTKLIDKADYIFSITQYQKDIFESDGFDGKKIFVIANLISEKRDFEEFKGFSNLPIFGIIGRFDPMKGFPVFIEACNILKNRNINFKVKIGGSPQTQYIDEYKRVKYLVRYYKLEDCIEFLGWIDNKDEFYENIDVFVLSSINEPFGIVLLEAMMYSKPIISSLAEGPSEIFKNNDGALMVSINDANELANAMIKFIEEPELAKKTAKAGYELVNNKFVLEKVADVLQKSIEKVCN